MCQLIFPAPALRATVGICGALLAISSAFAQSVDDQQSIKLGEADLYPSIRIDYVQNDNVGLLADNEVDGTATILRPELLFIADRRTLTFRAGYTGAYSFGSEGPLDYEDHRLSAGLSAEFDSRKRANVNVSLARRHIELGDSFTRGSALDVDEVVTFNEFVLNSRFGYGAEQARGRLVGGFDVLSLSYTNLNRLTDGRGYTRLRPYFQFGYRIGGDTRALIEARATTLSFDDSARDRDEFAVLVGFGFDATGSLSGELQLGAEQVSFSARDTDDETQFVIESNLRYEPTSFAALTLDLGRGINNSGLAQTGTGSANSTLTTARIGWDHQWSSRVSSDAFIGVEIRDETCPTISDSAQRGGVEVNVAVRRWLELGASFEAVSREGDECTPGDNSAEFDYQQQLLGIHVRATL